VVVAADAVVELTTGEVVVTAGVVVVAAGLVDVAADVVDDSTRTQRASSDHRSTLLLANDSHVLCLRFCRRNRSCLASAHRNPYNGDSHLVHARRPTRVTRRSRSSRLFVDSMRSSVRLHFGSRVSHVTCGLSCRFCVISPTQVSPMSQCRSDLHKTSHNDVPVAQRSTQFVASQRLARVCANVIHRPPIDPLYTPPTST
jgi:hypothetical protein